MNNLKMNQNKLIVYSQLFWITSRRLSDRLFASADFELNKFLQTFLPDFEIFFSFRVFEAKEKDENWYTFS